MPDCQARSSLRKDIAQSLFVRVTSSPRRRPAPGGTSVFGETLFQVRAVRVVEHEMSISTDE